MTTTQQDFKYPTEIIDLPSKGWFYPESSPLSSGQLELYYMTAKHEDILTSRNLIQKGVVIDKLIESLIVDPNIKIDDLLIGDKNAIMVAARILGYGKDYQTTIDCPECGERIEQAINLEQIPDKDIKFTPENKGKNQFSFQLPVSKKEIVFKLLTHKDEKDINAELEGLRKITKSDITKEVTTRMRYSIFSVDGETSKEKIRQFIDAMPLKDSKAFREFARSVNPDIDLTTLFECTSCKFTGKVEVPIDVTFFWPDARV